MRGGTSKGLFFRRDHLPALAREPGAFRDALLLRAMGSPDPFAQQIDGMGGATSSTSKIAIVSASQRPGHDVDFLFGQVAIGRALIDWSGNCGNLSAAVGAFAIHSGLIATQSGRSSARAGATRPVRIWQANIGKTIVAHVPLHDDDNAPLECGDFMLDGVAFPAPEVRLEFISPGAGDDEPSSAKSGGAPASAAALFPTGNVVDSILMPDFGEVRVTLINAGLPMIFVSAGAIGRTGTELPAQVNGDADALARLEVLRAHCALRMGLIASLDDACQRPATPKLAWVAAPAAYTTSGGALVPASAIDLVVRAVSMGRVHHHAMMGTGAVALAAAAAIPGTVVHAAIATGRNGRDARDSCHDRNGEGQAARASMTSVLFGHPSGTMRVGASVATRRVLSDDDTTVVAASSSTSFFERSHATTDWCVESVTMSRSARVLMDGVVHVPTKALLAPAARL